MPSVQGQRCGECQNRTKVVYSKYPIELGNMRTFQRFLWKDMPGASLPNDWYSPEELAIFRLSSKSHWDIQIEVKATLIHVLVSHPTPPVFDSPAARRRRLVIASAAEDAAAAEDDHGERLGFATLSHAPHFTGKRQAYINELATSDLAEGRGIGTALIATCEQ